MATSGQTYKNVFKQIFADGWMVANGTRINPVNKLLVLATN